MSLRLLASRQESSIRISGICSCWMYQLFLLHVPLSTGVPVQHQADRDGSQGGSAGLPGHRRRPSTQRRSGPQGGHDGHRPYPERGKRRGLVIQHTMDVYILNGFNRIRPIVLWDAAQVPGREETLRLQKALLTYLEDDGERDWSLEVSGFV